MSAPSENRVARAIAWTEDALTHSPRSEEDDVHETILALIDDWKRLRAENEALRKVAGETVAAAFDRLAKLERVLDAAERHLTACGPCQDAADDSDYGHCDEPTCTYCAIDRALMAMVGGNKAVKP